MIQKLFDCYKNAWWDGIYFHALLVAIPPTVLTASNLYNVYNLEKKGKGCQLMLRLVYADILLEEFLPNLEFTLRGLLCYLYSPIGIYLMTLVKQVV